MLDLIRNLIIYCINYNNYDVQVNKYTDKPKHTLLYLSETSCNMQQDVKCKFKL